MGYPKAGESIAMMHIITGSINAGKTTKMIEIYRQLKCGDGFVTQKLFKDSVHIGQNIVRLSTGEHKVFSLKSDELPKCWLEKFRYFNYSFSQDGMNFAEHILNEMIVPLQVKKHQEVCITQTQKNSTYSQNVGPIFIDEIGPLEIYHQQGLYSILIDVLASQCELYVVVRESCLVDFLSLARMTGSGVVDIMRTTRRL